jgi:hypothetical protein
MSAAVFWATLILVLLLTAVREEVRRFREHPADFAPLYRPGMNHRAIAAEVDGVLGQIEQAARAHQDEVRLEMPDMDTARVAAEILVRFGYRSVVQRGLRLMLRVSWQGD